MLLGACALKSFGERLQAQPMAGVLAAAPALIPALPFVAPALI